MMSIVFRLLLLGGIACIVVPGQPLAKGHRDAYALPFVHTQGIARHGSAHSEKDGLFAFAFKLPDAKQQKAVMKIFTQLPAAEHWAMNLEKTAYKTIHHNGWDKSMQVGVHNSLAMFDSMRTKLVTSVASANQ